MMMIYQTPGERCEVLAQYLIEHKATVRRVAQFFSVSKSTVHKDIAVRLKYVNPTLYENAKQILAENKLERHLRGGEATKQKYLSQRAKKTEKQADI
jgi:putative DeoR family transcriptional regulator (stage III sporulation protein D)